MKKNDVIDIECSCGRTNYLSFKSSFREQEIVCPDCGTTTHWHHCRDCDTGYYDTNPEGRCPDCTPDTDVTPAEMVKWRFLKKPCPWCGYPVTIVQHDHSIVNKCPSCRKDYEITGLFRFFVVFTISMGFLAKFSAGILLPPLQELLPDRAAVIIIAVLVTGFSFVIATKTQSVKKWKG